MTNDIHMGGDRTWVFLSAIQKNATMPNAHLALLRHEEPGWITNLISASLSLIPLLPFPLPLRSIFQATTKCLHVFTAFSCGREIQWKRKGSCMELLEYVYDLLNVDKVGGSSKSCKFCGCPLSIAPNGIRDLANEPRQSSTKTSTSANGQPTNGSFLDRLDIAWRGTNQHRGSIQLDLT